MPDQRTQSWEGDLKQNMVVLSELRKNGSKSRESAIARNCRASSREEGVKSHEVKELVS